MPKIKNLNYYCNLHKSDKGDDPNLNGHHYAGWYEKFLSVHRNSATNICEIGVQDGSSLSAWHDYFLNANIIGLDVKNKSRYNNDRINNYILDQSSSKELDLFVKRCNRDNLTFDLIVDDGSHDVEHQQLTFGKLFRLLKPNGIYIIEDMCTSYFKEGENLYGYIQTKEKLKYNTVSFLNNRPWASPWISDEDLLYINNKVSYVSLFDKPFLYAHGKTYKCINDYPPRSITSIIQKK
jgi:hypothetical protein